MSLRSYSETDDRIRNNQLLNDLSASFFQPPEMPILGMMIVLLGTQASLAALINICCILKELYVEYNGNLGLLIQGFLNYPPLRIG